MHHQLPLAPPPPELPPENPPKPPDLPPPGKPPPKPAPEFIINGPIPMADNMKSTINPNIVENKSTGITANIFQMTTEIIIPSIIPNIPPNQIDFDCAITPANMKNIANVQKITTANMSPVFDDAEDISPVYSPLVIEMRLSVELFRARA